jgi:hypothetical protein
MQGAQFCNSDKSLLGNKDFTLKNHSNLLSKMFHETAKNLSQNIILSTTKH